MISKATRSHYRAKRKEDHKLCQPTCLGVSVRPTATKSNYRHFKM